MEAGPVEVGGRPGRRGVRTGDRAFAWPGWVQQHGSKPWGGIEARHRSGADAVAVATRGSAARANLPADTAAVVEEGETTAEEGSLASRSQTSSAKCKPCGGRNRRRGGQ